MTSVSIATMFATAVREIDSADLRYPEHATDLLAAFETLGARVRHAVEAEQNGRSVAGVKAAQGDAVRELAFRVRLFTNARGLAREAALDAGRLQLIASNAGQIILMLRYHLIVEAMTAPPAYEAHVQAVVERDLQLLGQMREDLSTSFEALAVEAYARAEAIRMLESRYFESQPFLLRGERDLVSSSTRGCDEAVDAVIIPAIGGRNIVTIQMGWLARARQMFDDVVQASRMSMPPTEASEPRTFAAGVLN